MLTVEDFDIEKLESWEFVATDAHGVRMVVKGKVAKWEGKIVAEPPTFTFRSERYEPYETRRRIPLLLQHERPGVTVFLPRAKFEMSIVQPEPEEGTE